MADGTLLFLPNPALAIKERIVFTDPHGIKREDTISTVPPAT